MRAVSWWIGMTLLAGIPCACGSSSTTNEPSITLDDVPALYAASLCKAVNSCTPQFAEVFFGPNDCAALLAKRIEQASLPLIRSAVKTQTMTFNPSKLDACFAQVEQLGCRALDNEYVSACEDALGGTVPVVGACAFDDQCAGDAYCKYDGSCPGVCTTRELAGAVCRDDKECRTGLKCFQGKCTTKLPSGATCSADAVDCESGFMCGLDGGTGRHCLALTQVFAQPLGAECALAAGNWCQHGGFCAIQSVALGNSVQTCVERVASGAACYFSVGDMCPKDEYCEGTVISGGSEVRIEGTCRLLPVEGEPCTNKVDLGKACAKEHVCITTGEGSFCHKLRQNGESCTANAECYSEFCVGLLCKPKADCEVEAPR